MLTLAHGTAGTAIAMAVSEKARVRRLRLIIGCPTTARARRRRKRRTSPPSAPRLSAPSSVAHDLIPVCDPLSSSPPQLAASTGITGAAPIARPEGDHPFQLQPSVRQALEVTFLGTELVKARKVVSHPATWTCRRTHSLPSRPGSLNPSTDDPHVPVHGLAPSRKGSCPRSWEVLVESGRGPQPFTGFPCYRFRPQARPPLEPGISGPVLSPDALWTCPCEHRWTSWPVP